MKKVFFILFAFANSTICLAQSSIKLYAGKAPGSETWNWSEQKAANTPGNALLYNIVEPEILVYPAPKEKANGTAIVVAPGGAFHIISIENEGINVAKWLNERGITAFVLKYRLVKMLTDNPFKELMTLMGDFRKLDSINAPVVEMAKNDGIEAMKYVRTHAKELNIDPQKIGFMGFSAGGTVTMSVMLSAPQELKPNFIAPIYLYKNAVVGNLMPTKSTPIFVAVASDDQLGLMPHSIKLYEEWYAAKHPTELHVYEKGGHGFGIMKHQTSSDQWAADFENWLKMRGYCKQ
jgi:acetyl esterase/lipase